jgi:hypothetical protein
MDISITIHTETSSLNFDVLGCDFFVRDGEIRRSRAGMIVNDTWNNRSQNLGKCGKIWENWSKPDQGDFLRLRDARDCTPVD